jgi:cytoskeleton protein RodZ
MADRSSRDVGRTLREARERRGVSLRQVANATKIALSALEALERNDISRLPGGIFSRAFVRSYAIEVGLDPEATIQEFIAQFPHDSVIAGHPTSTHSEDHQAIDSDRRAATTVVRLIAMSIPIAGAIIYFGTAGRHVATSVVDAQPAPAAAALVEAPVALVETQPALVETVRAIEAPAAVPARPPVSIASASRPSDLLTVGLSVTGECWLSATVDGEKRIERLLQPGEQLALEVHRELLLTAGDASAVALTLNGAPAKPLGKAGKVVTVRLNLTNFQDFVVNR